ncbi:ubiquitin-protein ligase [Saccharomycopsis crataegensis]|uniref:E3 ubiquitin-protein ligase listerin n=1 Tax=Saccharomycopsis crataegensis TaxID=43959 RepID=A0AAV5QTG6_9ASCO|nr:ubiquitin-protein ligase [Saccharomycopsis crataegensis]
MPPFANNNPFHTSDHNTALLFNDIPFSFSFFNHVPNPTTIVNPDVKLMAKALLKKDTKTKLKSLNGLLNYFDQTTQDFDYSFLAFFIQEYPKLVINNDKFIRSTAHRLPAVLLQSYGKKIAVYLKSLVPIWLVGLYDSDKVVASETIKSMQACFKNDQSKIESLYTLFQKEILQVIEEFITCENIDTLVDKNTVPQDEASMMFTRALTSYVSLLNHIIANDIVQEKNIELVKEILSNNGKLWSHLSSHPDDYTYVSLKKALLTLLNTCFMSSNENYKLSNSTIFKQIFKLMKAIPSYKSFYASMMDLIIVTLINLDLSSLKADNLAKFKKAFSKFLSIGSFNNNEFFSYLDILYGKLSKSILDCSSIDDFSNFMIIPFSTLRLNNPSSTIKFFKFFNTNCSKFYENLPEKSRFVDLLQSQIARTNINENYSFIMNKLSQSDLDSILTYLNDQVAEDNLANYTKLLRKLENQKSAYSYYCKFFSSLLKNDSLLKGFNDLSFEGVKGAHGGPENQRMILELFLTIIKNNDYDYDVNKLAIINFLSSNISPYLKNNHFKLITKILVVVDKNFKSSALSSIPEFEFSKNISNRLDDLVKWVSGKIDDSELRAQFLTFLDNFANSSQITSEPLNSYITNNLVLVTHSMKSKYSTILRIVFKYCKTETWAILYLAVLADLKQENLLSFWKQFSATKNFEQDMIDFDNHFGKLGEEKGFFGIFWEILDTSDSAVDKKPIENILNKVENIIEQNEQLHQLYFNTLINYLSLSKGAKIITYFLTRFSTSAESLGKSIIPSTGDFLHQYVKFFDANHALCLALNENCLNNYLYTAIDKFPSRLNESKFQFQNIDQVIIYGNFILSLVTKSENQLGLNVSEYDSLLINLGSLSLFTADYKLFNTSNNILDNLEGLRSIENMDNVLIEFRESAISEILNRFCKYEPFSVRSLIDSNDCNPIRKILDFNINSGNEFVKFYSAKVYEDLAMKCVSKLNVEENIFPSIQSNYIKPKKVLHLFSLMPIFTSVLTKKNFEFFTKTLLSELLGYRSITGSSLSIILTHLITLNNLLIAQEEVTLPKIQLNMLIRNFQSWLGSDISYDVEFIPVRVQLVNFFKVYLSKNPRFNESVEFVITDLFIESLNIVSSSSIESLEEFDGETSEASLDICLNINLNYSLLKFFNVLKDFFNVEENSHLVEEYWSKDTRTEINDEFNRILSSFFKNQYIRQFNLNQGTLLIVGSYKKHYSNGNLDFTEFKSSLDDLVSSFVRDQSGNNLVLLGMRKLMFWLMAKVIGLCQKDFILEFALNYKSMVSDSASIENNDKIFKIPEQLINSIENAPRDFIEFESLGKTYSYLWSWLEILNMFYPNIPGFLQSIYLNQLPENSINELLGFIFNQIDLFNDQLIDMKKSKSLGFDSKNYDIFNVGGNDDLEDVKILLIHLYYMILSKFRFISQNWFMGIRNKQFKSTLEAFTTRYISPSIIALALDNIKELLESDSHDDNAEDDEDHHIVKFNKSNNEIKSQYFIDDQSTELSVKLPKSFPLSNIIMEAPIRLGVKENVWQSWILACQSLVNNGKFKTSSTSNQENVCNLVIEAVHLFDKNIKLHFKGFEECAICYAILHAQDKSLPAKNCQTCHKQFHVGCLLKWFKSSGNNTCPLCRQEFNFRVGV